MFCPKVCFPLIIFIPVDEYFTVLLFGTFYSFVRSSLSYIFPLVSPFHWYVIPFGTVLLFYTFFPLLLYVLFVGIFFLLVCSSHVYVILFGIFVLCVCFPLRLSFHWYFFIWYVLPHIMIFHLIFSSSWCVLIWIFSP